MTYIESDDTVAWEQVVEAKVLIATVGLVLVTWLLYKLVEWLEPRK